MKCCGTQKEDMHGIKSHSKFQYPHKQPEHQAAAGALRVPELLQVVVPLATTAWAAAVVLVSKGKVTSAEVNLIPWLSLEDQAGDSSKGDMLAIGFVSNCSSAEVPAKGWLQH